MKNIKAAVFDLDGTLVHTAPAYRYHILSQVGEELGFVPQKASMDRFWFETHRDLVIRNEFRVEPATFWQVYRKYDQIELRKGHAKPYEDVKFLQELKDRQIKLGIVTGAPKHIADMELAMLPISFDSIVLAREGIKHKPDPQGLLHCLQQMAVHQDDAFYAGNGAEDILTAKNANILDIYVDRGEYEFPNLRHSLRITSLNQLRLLFPNFSSS